MAADRVKLVDCWVPPELRDRLRKAASEREVSQGFLIRRALTLYLDALPPVESIDILEPLGRGLGSGNV